jgi:fructuronate reductase
MNDAPLARFVERMMREETAKTLNGALDIPHYIDQLLGRLRNPAIGHRLAQIAADGSMKLPYRCFEPIADLMAANQSCERLLIVAAAWMRFVVAESRAGRTLSDPRAAELAGIGRAARDAESDVGLFLALDNVFPKSLWRDRRFILALGGAYTSVLTGPSLPA